MAGESRTAVLAAMAGNASLAGLKGGRRRHDGQRRDARRDVPLDAALTSLAIAAGGLALVQHTGSSVWDGVASAAIGTILIGVAVVLAFESHSLLIGEAAAPDVERTIRDTAEGDPAVERLLALHTMHLGPDRVLAVLRVEFRATLSAGDVATAVDRLQDAIVRATPAATPHLVVIEPGRAGDGPGGMRALGGR
jgi:divalent metal cation (Fe/Co/Zn/Cd) transporter